MPPSLEIRWRDQELHLLASRALWWPRRRALVVADLHLGKPAAYRALGVPAPEAVTDADLARLDQAIGGVHAERLIILGDLIHAASGRTDATMDAVARWRRAHQTLDILVVRGNHDRRAGDPPTEWRCACVDGPHREGDLDLVHEPDSAADRPALAGHMHPAVAGASTTGPSRLRAPCFWFGASVAVLPAFGVFTGARAVRPGRGDRVFAVGEGSVLEVACAASDRRR